jgi:hypothetical protein
VTYNTIQYPIQSYIRHDKLSKNYYSFLFKIEDSIEPNRFEDAKKTHIKWVNAMNKKLEALK